MMQPHGSYAEYAIAPAHTTFHIASTTSFEEAATVPLAAMTSALALHIELGLPTPWKPATKRIPLIIYGGSTAVGAFAIKLAKLANIGPIIAVAGSGIPYVKSLGPDKIVDYREGNVAAALREALGGEKCYHAIDAISETESYTTLGEVLAKPGCTIVTVLPGKEYTDFPEDVEMKVVMVSAVHKATSGPAGMPVAPDAMDFGHAMFRFFARAMADGRFSGHPQTIIEGGLEGVDKGMKLLSEGKASATKYVYRFVPLPLHGWLCEAAADGCNRVREE